uniref:Transmembrane protein n=1 Tax=Maylandia zebra TaxID=106582 RepID=A0A3P9DUY7_9CICH
MTYSHRGGLKKAKSCTQSLVDVHLQRFIISMLLFGVPLIVCVGVCRYVCVYICVDAKHLQA